MPYADNFCDLVAITDLSDSDLDNISYAEVERVLCPGAKAWVGRAAAEGGGISTRALTKWIAAAHCALSSAAVVTDTAGTWAVIAKIGRLPDTYEGPCIQANSGSWFYNDKKATWPCLPQWYAKPYGTSMAQSKGFSSDTRFSVLSSGGGRLYGSEIDAAPAIMRLR